ncbi:MAG: cell division protein SepF [Clostridia bacterium]|nr:cell division protein SepF [Clostridia bacterium]
MFNFTKKNKYSFEDDVEMDDFGAYSDTDENADAEDDVVAPVAPVETPAAPAFNANPISLKIITPKAYDDAREITEFLMNGNTVLLNMDGISRDLAIRILDYIKGALQVVGGMMTKVGKTTLVVAPKNVDVSSIEAMVGTSDN